jgi:hypothetical protein
MSARQQTSSSHEPCVERSGCDALVALALALALLLAIAAPLQAHAADAACTQTDATAAVAAFRALDSSVADVRIANRSSYIAMERASDLLLYRAFEKTATGDIVPKLAYTIMLVDLSKDERAALNLLRKDDVGAEEATQGDKGTDFRLSETKNPKTLLRFTARLPANQGYEGPPWSATRLFVVGCDAAGMPQVKGQIDLRRSSVAWSRVIAMLCCLFGYLCAATGTFHVHRRERVDPNNATLSQPKVGTN